MRRYYYESDGGPRPGRRTYYVVDRYANPLGDARRRDCESRREALVLARQLNAHPSSPPWDTIQAARDKYTYRGEQYG